LRISTIMLATAGTAALIVAAPAQAQSAPDSQTITELKSEIEQLRANATAANARVEALELRLQGVENARGVNAPPIPDADQANLRGRGVQAYSAPQSTPVPDAEPDRKAPASAQAVEAVAQSQQNIYGSSFSIDPGISYSHFTNAKLNLSGFLALDTIFLGLISIDQVQADVATADVTARYGFNDRLQIDVNVPYIYRRSKFRSGGAGGNASALAERTVTSSGLGDISFGASYRLLRETARRPDVVLSLRGKAPTGDSPFGIELTEVPDTQGNFHVPNSLATGTGVWAATAGLSVLKTIDPMIVFGSLNYFHNLRRHFNDLGEVDGDQPGDADVGDAWQYGAGVAFALNDSSSLGLSFTERFVRSTRVKLDGSNDWQRIIGSDANIGILTLGATFALSDRLALLASLSHGMTDDAPDMTVSFRLPYRF
jgi:hypothetical protein